MGIAFFGVDTYVPLYVQGTTGAGAKAAAGVVTPVMLAWAISGIFAAPMIVRWGFRRTAIRELLDGDQLCRLIDLCDSPSPVVPFWQRCWP